MFLLGITLLVLFWRRRTEKPKGGTASSSIFSQRRWPSSNKFGVSTVTHAGQRKFEPEKPFCLVKGIRWLLILS